ncbi:TrmH family RNA methyltransferase [Rhodothermus profundi]|uniref:tRNA (guanosine(18)-2'-O)-methyltransferase n=1 Tax=Rhodothermus profundi TaxID=633813 RepID=A0A1M6VZ04_9BACT|nr:RNA methyltransferase [Rhodothermus profundi]SHK86731.1 tRNA (guanosine-2'-O-)-methyltransferase [Rhodothermus profundi]
MLHTPTERLQQELTRVFQVAAQQGHLTNPQALAAHFQKQTPDLIVEWLRPYVTARRQQRIEQVLEGRTYTVVPVIEGLANTGNISAVMRSAEALGYQGFGIIKGNVQKYKTSERTSQGADKWLDVWTWPTAAEAVPALKAAGYRVVATTLDAAAPIDTFDFTVPTALVFGNEVEGVSKTLLAQADARCVIPIVGFTQSFNISVAAAIALYHAQRDRLARQGRHGDLSPAWKATLRAVFYLRSVQKAGVLLWERLQREGG